jgi:ribonuclease HII
MGKLVLGVDEAGRGAVVGPLFIGAVIIDEDESKRLHNLGVKDSKKLTRFKREKLEPEIKDMVKDFAVLEIPAKSIDELMKRKSLNRIETEKMAELIDALKPDVAIVDATEVKTEKIENEIRSLLEKNLRDRVSLKAENYADDNYPIVSAASILAKVARDNSISSLEKRLGKEIGKGYPSDERTKKFLKEVIKNGQPPEYIRKCWTTTERILEQQRQGNLSDFCKIKDGARKKEK